MNSLKTRLLVSSVIVLVFFVGFTGFVLDSSFVRKATSSVSLRLQSQVYDLIRLVDQDERDGLLDFPAMLPNPRLMQPNSGYYAAVSQDQKIQWRSPSSEGIEIPYNNLYLNPGEHRFTKVKASNGSELFLLSLGYVWADEKEKPVLYIFHVAESDQNFLREVSLFRKSLWLLLGLIIILSLIIQRLTLNWGLMPLNRLRKDLTDIEEGKREYLNNNYIEEIKDLTTDLNTLLRFERGRQKRYRNSLGDLAHSFKTSLAIINSTVNNDQINKKTKTILVDQVGTLNDLVTYHLRRAQAAGTKASLSKPVNVQGLVDKIILALSKVHQVKNIQFIQDIDKKAMFYGDKGDLLEVLGNLLDNAHKWCNNTVKLTATETKQDDGTLLTIVVEDDGPGVPDEKKSAILKRGVRADEHTPGHGIGLSILTDIVAAYSGEIVVTDSDLGGAKFRVNFRH
ncbi:MAG: GHKL domain-containing protein [Gammaproteobacteria bacterium]|nr:GHKL domain-containing protein [Gammaproteobacteria bacterium]